VIDTAANEIIDNDWLRKGVSTSSTGPNHSIIDWVTRTSFRRGPGARNSRLGGGGGYPGGKIVAGLHRFGQRWPKQHFRRSLIGSGCNGRNGLVIILTDSAK
jgi:hypothetical protein